MKRIRRFLAILLCVCLVTAPMCSALADDDVLAISEGETTPIETETDESEDVSEPVTPETPPAETESGEDEVVPGGTDETTPENGTTPPENGTTPPESEIVDPNAPGVAGGDTVIESGDGDPTGNPPAETDPEPSDAPEDTGKAEDPNAIDYSQSAAASPAFCQGYAELKPDTTAYAESGIDAQVLGTIGGGVVYVLGRATTGQTDRLNVAFDWEGVRYAWVDADCARPMTPDETASFIIGCSAREDGSTLPDHPELPLDKLTCVPAAASGDEGAPQDEPETVDAPAEIQVPEAKLVVPESLVLGVGETRAIGARFDDGESYLIEYTPGSEGIVSVSQDGVITALAAGETTVKLHCDFDDAQVHVTVKAAPTGVTLSAPRTVLGVNEALQLEAKLPEGEEFALTFATSDASVATVSEAGLVTTFAAGTVTITAKTYNEISASVTLTVLPAPEDIALNLTELTLGVGQTAQLMATLTPANAANFYEFSVTESAPEGAVQVDPQTGRIEALVPGAATVTVETYNHKAASCQVTVNYAPEEVAFAETEIEIGINEYANIPLNFTAPEGAAEDAVCTTSCTYTTTNAKVASVDGAGNILGRKTGTAYITVMTHNKKYATLTVRVYKAPKKMYLSVARTTLGQGETIQLWPWSNSGTVSRKVTYTSSDESVATVDASGLVTASDKNKGTTVITATAFNGKSASQVFTVVDAPSGVTLNLPENDEVAVEQPLSVTATLPEGTAGSYTFKSNKPDIVDVDENSGALTAKREGTAEITVTTYNQKTDTKTITVVPAPDKITLAEEYIEMGVGEGAEFPEITPDKGKATYTFWSSKPKVVTVYGNGSLWARKTGTAYITVMTHNKKYATLTVRVCKAPKKVYIGAHHTTLGVGEKLTPWAWVSSGAVSRGLTYTSSNEAILHVTNPATGEFEAVGTGIAAITVATYNNKYASLWFTVLEEPTSVALTPKPLTLGAGEWYTVGSTTQPENSGGDRTYSIDAGGESVATIDPTTGAIHALAVGTATVRVTMYNDLCTDAFTLTVKPEPTGIRLNNADYIELGVGDSFQIPRPTPLDGDAHSETFTYASTKTKYVTVSGTGRVYANKAGSAWVYVATYNNKCAAFLVTVKAAPKSIGFGEAEHRLFMNRKYTPTVWFENGVSGNYTLINTDETVIRICEDGKTVESIKPGTVTLAAKSYNDKSAWMQIWVPELPEWVKLDPATITLGRGDSITMRAVVPEGAGAEMTFTSDNTGVASFESVDNETITVTAAGVGDTVIHVKTQNGKESQASIKVLEAPTALSLSPSRAERCIEEKSLQLSWAFGAAGEGGRMEFTSSNPNIATVDAGGLVTFKGIGTTRITARTYNGHEAACDLRVGEKPGKMFFEQETYQVALNDSVRIPASFDKGCVSYTLQADEGGVVEINGDVVHALRKGKVKLTAHSNMYDLTAECTVEVVDAPNGIKADIEDVIELVVGISSTRQLHAIPLLDGKPSVGTVHYATSDPAVAVVDYDTGLVTPKGKGADGKGECTITARTYNGYETTYQVRVTYLLEGKKIGIDPGHQGKGNMSKERMAPNSKSTKYKCAHSSSGVARVSEHIINLQVGLQLRDALQKLGAEVYMTRESADVDISNKQRAELMNYYGVDFVLRLHCNAAGTSSAQGLSIIRRKSWAYTENGSDKATVGGQVVTGVKDYGKWVMKAEESLGRSIADYYIWSTGCKWRGLGTSNEYTMNNWSAVPCLLVELGFMTNPTEGKKLVQADYQHKMVVGLVNGICNYYGVALPTEW